MSRSQLEEMTAFVRDNLPDRARTAAAKFASYMENVTLLDGGRDLGLGEMVGAIQYEAVLEWERFPYRLCQPQRVFALVLAWLDEQASSLRSTLELPPPEIEVELIDEETAYVVVSVQVVEPLGLVPNEQGDIPWRGQRWSVESPEIWTAEQGRLFAVDESGAPLAERDLDAIQG
ncbi:phage tail protein [Salmonella enterica]|uniref:Phage tail protein n=2 Tax=Edwardsiella tarda TaxID=636 RepID=A0A2A7U7E6_EDWTA|nr:phage tail protein [Edwardsiella tarda]EAM9788465.1 phage tail protein [Salmonella enterica]ATI63797.1 phage tail protein [Edwardsiella tarda]EAU1443668.1 phage tail protein [Salmonella enterica]PEH74163.1 phage tail protein [Edwardsiella tarda]BEH73718.1 phage tail protein [Edwardsiella tarda]